MLSDLTKNNSIKLLEHYKKECLNRHNYEGAELISFFIEQVNKGVAEPCFIENAHIYAYGLLYPMEKVRIEDD